MAFDRFLIAPFNTGLQTDLRPFLIMDDAFTYLQNAYVFRGRVRKRFGSLLMGTLLQSRLAVNIGTVTTHAIPANPASGASQLQVGQWFSVGSDIFTITTLGASELTLSTNPGATATIDSVSNPNTVTFTGESGAAIVLWYPSNPVMGITQYESNSINNHPSYAFDTQFAYVYTPNVGWLRSGTAVWKGTNLNYFWAVNWRGKSATGTIAANTGNPVMFVTNFNFTLGAGAPAATDDPIWYTVDGSTWVPLIGTLASTNGIFFLPNGGAPYTGPFVQTALMLVVFRDRLLLLNTVENNNSSGTGTGTATHYKNRVRYSWLGSPLAVQAWYERNQPDSSGNVAAGAGFFDLPTEEAIISAEFVKDRLIVYCERSTYEIAYTGIQTDPFQYNKLNTELGSQSTFGTIPRDKEATTIGNTGIHACNGSNVVRIDQKIPAEIFDAFETKNHAPKRIQGIRDYFNELFYWIFVDVDAVNQNFPNQILVYNYQNGSWALNDDCFTAFGYFEQQQDITWASSEDITWQQFNGTWQDNVIEANQRQIIAGTPEGFVLRIAADVSRNAPSAQITTMTIPSVTIPQAGYVDLEIINHNLSAGDAEGGDGDFIAIENTFGISLPIKGFYEVYRVIDENNVTIYAPDITGTYLGGGTIARVSNIQFTTKQINPYDKEGSDVYLGRVDFMVEKTSYGQITVDYAPSSSELSMLGEANRTNSIMGTGVLETYAYPAYYYPLEQTQQRLVHPIYFQTTGTCVQLDFYQTAAQLSNGNIAWSDFELAGMIWYTEKAGRIQ
jgi:hypothetical protein